jgi:hypothetical protein
VLDSFCPERVKLNIKEMVKIRGEIRLYRADISFGFEVLVISCSKFKESTKLNLSQKRLKPITYAQAIGRMAVVYEHVFVCSTR